MTEFEELRKSRENIAQVSDQGAVLSPLETLAMLVPAPAPAAADLSTELKTPTQAAAGGNAEFDAGLDDILGSLLDFSSTAVVLPKGGGETGWPAF